MTEYEPNSHLLYIRVGPRQLLLCHHDQIAEEREELQCCFWPWLELWHLEKLSNKEKNGSVALQNDRI